MLKLFGAVLLICGTSAWGMLGVMKMRRRCRILTELALALGAMRGELTTRLTPVPELLARMAGETSEPVRTFFGNVEKRLCDIGDSTLYDIWSAALDETDSLLLLPDERDALREVPRALGRYELEEQRLALLRSERQLEQFAQRAEEVRERDSRVKGFLGVAAGAFLALMLI